MENESNRVARVSITTNLNTSSPLNKLANQMAEHFAVEYAKNVSKGGSDGRGRRRRTHHLVLASFLAALTVLYLDTANVFIFYLEGKYGRKVRCERSKDLLPHNKWNKYY